MKTFNQFINEVLNDEEKADVAAWPKRTKKATAATDDYFGKGNEEKVEPLEGTADKSEVHKQIERHLGKQIHSDDYKAGTTTDEHGRTVRIGKLLSKTKAADEVKRGFENDNTRQAKTAKGLTVRTTRSAEGVAGQTSHNQSWEQQSCKNFNTGVNKHYLKHEVKHGTVVQYLHDENGKEIARATLHPHTNDAGHTIYRHDSYYGINHAGFKKHVEETAKRLSGPHKGGSIVYHIHPDVYNDSGKEVAVHPNATSAHLDEALNDKDSKVRAVAARHPNATSAHLDKASNDKDPEVRAAAARHPNATSAHLDKASNDKDSWVRAAAANHPNATSAHLDKALNDKDSDVRRVAARHPNATSAHLDKASNDEDYGVRKRAAQHPNATSAHLDKALNDKNSDVRESAARNPNATSAHLDKASNDKDSWVRAAAANHPNAPRAHLEAITNNNNGRSMKTFKEFVTEAFADDGKMSYDDWQSKAKEHGAVKFVDTKTHTHAYDKDGKKVSSIPWSSKKSEKEYVTEVSAPELLKAQMPLVNHIHKLVTSYGHTKGTPEYNKSFDELLAYHRKFGFTGNDNTRPS